MQSQRSRPFHATRVTVVSLEVLEEEDEKNDPYVDDDEDWWPSFLDDPDQIADEE